MKDRTEYFRKWKAKNRARIRVRERERYQANLEKMRAYHNEWQRQARAKNPEKYKVISQSRAEYFRQYRVENKEKIASKDKQWWANNPHKWREYREKRRAVNPDEGTIRMRNWRRNNGEYVRATAKQKRAIDLNWRLLLNLRARLVSALRGHNKSASTIKLLGCTIESLWIYLESRFEEGMTKENYGKFWEVDHIIPCVLFDLTKEDHQRRCFHYSNLQPLTVVANRRKGAKLQQLNKENT